MNDQMRQETKRILAQVNLFKALTTDEMELLGEIVCPQNFQPEDVILREGEKGRSKLYIIVDGTVEIHRHTVFGDEYTVAQISGGQNCFFGEVSLLDNEERSATVKAITSVKTLAIEHEHFISFCDRNMAIGYKI